MECNELRMNKVLKRDYGQPSHKNSSTLIPMVELLMQGVMEVNIKTKVGNKNVLCK